MVARECFAAAWFYTIESIGKQRWNMRLRAFGGLHNRKVDLET